MKAPIDIADFVAMDGIAMATAIKAGEISAPEAVATSQLMARALNPQLNAFVEIFEVPLAYESKGAFCGTPFAIKDLVCHAAGVLNENGSALTAGLVTPHDTWLMQRWRHAGLQTIGRLATPEFGYCATTEPKVHGAVRNPWDLTRSSGGSSGASSAVVAAGIVPFAHANDGGGSVRIPAACTGLIGLKPSRGRISFAPDGGEGLSGLAIEFAVTRSVRDAAALLDQVAVPAPGDPYMIERAVPSYRDALMAGTKPLRIAVMTDPWSGSAVEAEVKNAVAEAQNLCLELGHSVYEAQPALAWEPFLRATHVFWSAHVHHWIAAMEAATGRAAGPETLEATTWAVYQEGAALSARDFLKATGVANQITRDMAVFFGDYDVLMSPVLASLPVKIGTINADDHRHSARDWTAMQFDYAPFTPPFNMTGQPAISLPLGSANGVPIGVQFVAAAGREDILLALAQQLERVKPFKTVSPLWRELLP
ncbi:MAG: amidase family protein [Pseudomonadota bacterium]